MAQQPPAGFGTAYPTGGDSLEEYLRVTSQKLGRMPVSGSTTAARPPAPQTNGVPMAGNGGDGFMSSMGKMAGNMAMQKGMNWAMGKGGDAFQNYLNQWNMAQNMNNPAMGGNMTDAYGNGIAGGDAAMGMDGMMAGTDAAGSGMDMASMFDYTSLAM
jgi:hypothetical protein